jgi:hypothetical protein
MGKYCCQVAPRQSLSPLPHPQNKSISNICNNLYFFYKKNNKNNSKKIWIAT